MSVQHVVNAVEVEKSEIIEETMRRMKPIIQEKINQETKRIVMDKATDIPVVAQRQVPQVHVVKKTVEDPQFEIVEKTVENPETVPQMQVVEKTTEIPQFRVAHKVVDVPAVFVVLVTQVQVVVKTVQIPQLPLVEKIAAEIRTAPGTQTSESLNGEFDAGHDEKSGQVDVERVQQHTGAAAWQRQPHCIKQQPTVQTAQAKEREIERRGVREGEKKKRGQVEKEKGQVEKEKGSGRERERGERGKREEKTGEEGKEVQEETDNEVEKDVTGWTEVTRNKRKKMVQIFVKVDGMKTAAMEVSPEDKVQKILNIVSKCDRDVYVTSGGRILKRSDKPKSCEVRDGSTVEVTSRMRGGGRHKDKKSKSEKKQITNPERLEQKRDEVPRSDEGPKMTPVEEALRWLEEQEGYQQIIEDASERSEEEDYLGPIQEVSWA